jgi:hypothetical protein
VSSALRSFAAPATGIRSTTRGGWCADTLKTVACTDVPSSNALAASFIPSQEMAKANATNKQQPIRTTERGFTRSINFVADCTAIQGISLGARVRPSFCEARRAIEQIAQLPDRAANLFVKICLSNGGKLSAAKRKTYFSKLTDKETRAMERAVNAHMGQLVRSSKASIHL